MHESLLLVVLVELLPRESELRGNIFNLTLLGELDHISLEWLLPPILLLTIILLLQLLVVVGAKIADQGVEVIQVTLALCELKLIKVDSHV